MKYPQTSTGKFPFFETNMLMRSYDQSIKGKVLSKCNVIDAEIDQALKVFLMTYGEYDNSNGKYTGLL